MHPEADQIKFCVDYDAKAGGKVLLKRNDVETVALLINQNTKAKHHVRISIDAEDYYRIKDSEKKEDER